MLHSGRVLINEELSPHKIGLFVLIKLYLSNEIPLRSKLLKFIVSQLEGNPLFNEDGLVVVPSLKDLCDAVRSHFLKTKSRTKNHSRDVDMAVQLTQTKVLGIFWKMSSPDDLFEIFADAYNTLSEPLKTLALNEVAVSPRSLLGTFVQRMVVTLKLLQFEESFQLFNSICQYRESTYSMRQTMVKTPNLEGPLLSADEVTKISHGSSDNKSAVPKSFPTSSKSDEELFATLRAQLATHGSINDKSSDHSHNSGFIQIARPDLEALIDSQVSLLEHFGTPTPNELKLIMKGMAQPELSFNLSHGPHISDFPSYHYLNYLEKLHVGDYHGAFDYLHQYFDYMVSKGSKYFYHFALISRASLHRYFSEDGKALDSIEEAISVARENKDNATLTYILSWLFDFIRNRPSLLRTRQLNQSHNQLRLLNFLMTKSLSVSLLLAATSFRFEAEHLMNRCEHFSRYYENLFNSQYISVNDHIVTFISTCNLTSLVWERTGFPHLSELYTNLGLRYASAAGTKHDAFELRLRAENFKCRRGNADLAIQGLISLLDSPLTDLAQHRSLRLWISFINIEVALRKGRKRLASEMIKQIPENAVTNLRDWVRRTGLHALVLAANGNHSLANQIISLQISKLSSDMYDAKANALSALDLTILKGQILVNSGAHFRVFSMLAQELETMKSLGLVTLLLQGIVLLIQLTNAAGNPDDALAMGEEILPTVVCDGEHHLISTLHFEMTKSYAQLMRTETEGLRRKDVFGKLLSFLSISIAGFKKTPDLVSLAQCFELEKLIAASEEMKESNPIAKFEGHSQSGLEILDKRRSKESQYGYLCG